MLGGWVVGYTQGRISLGGYLGRYPYPSVICLVFGYLTWVSFST